MHDKLSISSFLVLVGILFAAIFNLLFTFSVTKTKVSGQSKSFGKSFMCLIEHVIPQTLAEQCVGSSLEDYERRRPVNGDRWGDFWAGFWLVKEFLYAIGPIVGGRLSRLVLWGAGAFGVKRAADWLSKMIGD